MITRRRKMHGRVGLRHLRLDTKARDEGEGARLPGTEPAVPSTLAITTERLPLLTTAPSTLKANALRPLCPRLFSNEPLFYALPGSWDLKCGTRECSPPNPAWRVKLRWRLAHSTVSLTTVALALGCTEPASSPGCWPHVGKDAPGAANLTKRPR